MHFLRALNRKYLSLPFWARLPISVCCLVGILILIQNPLIFPGAVVSLFNSTTRDPETLPNGVSSSFVGTSDGKRLELWKLAAGSGKPVAVIFHGNGGDVENFFPYQEYFSSIGITSYGLDYRGYGKSSGWPTERGLEIDSETALNHILATEQISAHDLIIVGVSVGSGVASYAATKVPARAVILFSPFTSLPDAIRSRPVVGLLSRFSFYEFPVQSNIAQLSESCVIVAHGDKDNVIPHVQGREVYEKASAPFSRFILSSGASHNDLLFQAHSQVTEAIRACLGMPRPPLAE